MGLQDWVTVTNDKCNNSQGGFLRSGIVAE